MSKRYRPHEVWDILDDAYKEAWEERAAIREYEGEMDREEAERLAV